MGWVSRSSLLVPVAAALLSLACGTAPVGRASGGDAEVGRRTIATYGCGSCHQIPGVDDADGLVGPPLDHMGSRTFIAGELANTPDNMARWVMDPQQVEPGTAMPDLGISEAEAHDIAAYLQTLE